ncbi:hypothetical protein [Methyloglobulus sp.]|uniref:hypothetical protein n=1 Tax=Methyloglobulus sp. TaxID=2518622 RepID=UPI0032B76BAB
MRLRVKFEDGSIIVYQEKWAAIAYQLAMGFLCIFIAAYFYYIGASTSVRRLNCTVTCKVDSREQSTETKPRS